MSTSCEKFFNRNGDLNENSSSSEISDNPRQSETRPAETTRDRVEGPETRSLPGSSQPRRARIRTAEHKRGHGGQILQEAIGCSQPPVRSEEEEGKNKDRPTGGERCLQVAKVRPSHDPNSHVRPQQRTEARQKEDKGSVTTQTNRLREENKTRQGETNGRSAKGKTTHKGREKKTKTRKGEEDNGAGRQPANHNTTSKNRTIHATAQRTGRRPDTNETRTKGEGTEPKQERETQTGTPDPQNPPTPARGERRGGRSWGREREDKKEARPNPPAHPDRERKDKEEERRKGKRKSGEKAERKKQTREDAGKKEQRGEGEEKTRGRRTQKEGERRGGEGEKGRRKKKKRKEAEGPRGDQAQGREEKGKENPPSARKRRKERGKGRREERTPKEGKKRDSKPPVQGGGERPRGGRGRGEGEVGGRDVGR
ncbi:hypothetical protein ACROYT_G017962 [Oculina patagonica]